MDVVTVNDEASEKTKKHTIKDVKETENKNVFLEILKVVSLSITTPSKSIPIFIF